MTTTVVVTTDFSWLEKFDPENIVEFSQELSDIIQQVAYGLKPTSAISTVILEWKKSAEVLHDPIAQQRLRIAMQIQSPEGYIPLSSLEKEKKMDIPFMARPNEILKRLEDDTSL